jgi:hypothetical protein
MVEILALPVIGRLGKYCGLKAFGFSQRGRLFVMVSVS